jgi:hypothetical protein
MLTRGWAAAARVARRAAFGRAAATPAAAAAATPTPQQHRAAAACARTAGGGALAGARRALLLCAPPAARRRAAAPLPRGWTSVAAGGRGAPGGSADKETARTHTRTHTHTYAHTHTLLTWQLRHPRVQARLSVLVGGEPADAADAAADAAEGPLGEPLFEDEFDVVMGDTDSGSDAEESGGARPRGRSAPRRTRKESPSRRGTKRALTLLRARRAQMRMTTTRMSWRRRTMTPV